MPEHLMLTLPADHFFAGQPAWHHGLVLADPPWNFANWSPKGELKNPNQHYKTHSKEWIWDLPVGDLMDKDAICIMWATAPCLHDAVHCMMRWGFEFKTAGAWAKRTSTGEKWAFGPGYWLRSAAEFWLLGTRGKPHIIGRSIRNLIVAPTREHSRKPDEMYGVCEALNGGPYIELFARHARPGWNSCGDQL